MGARQMISQADDQTLAATAVRTLTELAQRKRNSRDYEFFAFVRDGAKAIETRTIPDVRKAGEGR